MLTATPLTVGAATASNAAPYSAVASPPTSTNTPSPPAPAPPSGEAEPEAQLPPSSTVGVTEDPIDPRFLTAAPFGTTSFWIQPWRAYMDTWPASRLLDAVGINFDVPAAQSEATAQLLQDSGFELARIGVNWDAISYEDPSRFDNEASIRSRLLALARHGLRPLILLDANSEDPAPAKRITLTTLTAAAAGAQSVRLSPESAAQVVPGKTGFDGLSFGGSPDVLITAVGHEDLATLSRPLPNALAAGEHKGATLLYAPFQAPTLPNGAANPAFEETLDGWLGYVRTVCRLAGEVLGPGGFDLEVWNELSFGSQFLNYEHYYSTGSESAGEAEEQGLETQETEAEENELVQGSSGGISSVTKEVVKALLQETVAFVRDPANRISPAVGVSDGFASQSPFPSGAQAPSGLTALSKHLYNSPKTFPAAYREGSLRPLNALGARDTASSRSTKPLYLPSFESAFPEYFLTALSTETLVRDVAPIQTSVYGQPHGREVAPPGSSEGIQKWMTEYNLNPGKGTIVGPDETTPVPSAKLTAADKHRFQAKALLRSLVAMVGKGMTREYFFHAGPGALSLIGEEFDKELAANPSEYPGDALGGETLASFKNLLSHFQGPGPGGSPRQLELTSIEQEGDHAQFQGDGSAAHPSLYDREVLAVLPFQSSPTRFVIPVYVMTRNLLTLYRPDRPSSDPNRFDLPNETFRIKLTNLPAATAAPTVTAYDPIHDQDSPARLISQEGDTAEIEIAATDYPRLLTLEYLAQ